MEARGVGKFLGNKGGMIISFCLRKTSFCFINCHLAAYVNNVDKRNRDYYSLTKNLKTGNKEWEAPFYFDYCFWFGDLNYRVDYDW